MPLFMVEDDIKSGKAAYCGASRFQQSETADADACGGIARTHRPDPQAAG